MKIGTTRCLVFALLLTLTLVGGIWFWDRQASNNSVLVIYFGRPSDAMAYIQTYSADLAKASLACLVTAIFTVFLAGFTAFAMLGIGLFSSWGLRAIETVAAMSQTVPILVVATLSLLVERWIFQTLDVAPAPDWYCVAPVTLSLLFTPLINGADAISRVPVPLKAMLRLWAAPNRWRIIHIYLPSTASEVLTGVRASAAWAVGAVLITEALVSGIPGNTVTLGRPLMNPFKNIRGETLTVLVVSTILGLIVYLAFSLLQNWVELRLFGRVSENHAAYTFQAEE